MLLELAEVLPHSVRDISAGHFPSIPDPSTFHLVEDRVVASVDGITAIDVSAYYVAATLVVFEKLSFMRAGVGAENGILIDVICVCFASPWMICRKP